MNLFTKKKDTSPLLVCNLKFNLLKYLIKPEISTVRAIGFRERTRIVYLLSFPAANRVFFNNAKFSKFEFSLNFDLFYYNYEFCALFDIKIEGNK